VQQTQPTDPATTSRRGALLVVAVFLAATCGLIYELVAGTLSSYLLGDSITQFSLVIGVFLTAMGIGSFLSRFITRDLVAWFIFIEVAVGVTGGLAALIGFAAFSYTELYEPVLFGLVLIIGTLVGLEIPLVVRILKEVTSLRVTLANVLSADYVGALVASIAFPFALLPHLGLVHAGVVAGLANVWVGGLLLLVFKKSVGARQRLLMGGTLLATVLLVAAMIFSGRLVKHFESRLYQDEIILAKTTKTGARMIVTRWRDDIRLYLNGHLQFSTIDEYRYHEALVHPPMAAARQRERVLILGGGDGLAARLVLQYPEVKRIDIVDLDPDVTRHFRNNDLLASINDKSLSDERVQVTNQDAFTFLQQTHEMFDVVLIDLPDPSAAGLSKLYSEVFYGLVGRHLRPGGAMSCQCTSPFRARAAYWCIVHTAAAARWGPENQTRFEVRPYHTLVPTFGTWGFMLAGTDLPEQVELPASLQPKYLTPSVLQACFVFPPDMSEVETPINGLDRPVVYELYQQGYHKYLN